MARVTIVTGCDGPARARVFEELSERVEPGAGVVTHPDARHCARRWRDSGARRALVEASDPLSVACAALTGGTGGGPDALAGIVTVLDARRAAARLAGGGDVVATPRAAAQLVMADVVVLCRTSGLRAGVQYRLRCAAKAANPMVPVVCAPDSGVDGLADTLLDLHSDDPYAIAARLGRAAAFVREVLGVVIAAVRVPVRLDEGSAWGHVAGLVAGRHGLCLRFDAALPLRDGSSLVVSGIGPVIRADRVAFSVPDAVVAVAGADIDAARVAHDLRTRARR